MRSIVLFLLWSWLFLLGVPAESAVVGVSGVVRDASGAALAQARIVVFDETTQTETLSIAVDNQGRFALELEPGHYVVSVSAEHFATTTFVSAGA